MKPKFLADADFNHRVLAGLRRREPGIDFLAANEGGTVGLADPKVLELAAHLDRIVLTHDRSTMPRHYSRFLRANESPGLIVVPQSLEIGETIEDLLLIWAVSRAEEWRNQVLFLPI